MLVVNGWARSPIVSKCSASCCYVHVVVEHGQTVLRVAQERVCSAKMIEVMDNGRHNQHHTINVVQNILRTV